MWTRVRARGVLEWEGTQPARSVLIRGCPFDSVAPLVPTSQACATALCLQVTCFKQPPSVMVKMLQVLQLGRL